MTAPQLQPQKPTLTDRLRVSTAGLLDPVVALLARAGISPDLLTILGMVSHALFGWLVATGRLPLAALAIFLLVPLDSLDGALARRLGRPANHFGAFLDSTADRLAEILLFAGFLVYFYRQDQPWFVALSYLALTGSLMVSYARARAEGLGVSCKVGILSRAERYALIVVTLALRLPEATVAILALGTYLTLGQRILHVYRNSRRSST
jgi:CDP-diacylglycerol--glycerol-3-phosphate 3-phosphatidyltransferase